MYFEAYARLVAQEYEVVKFNGLSKLYIPELVEGSAMKRGRGCCNKSITGCCSESITGCCQCGF